MNRVVIKIKQKGGVMWIIALYLVEAIDIVPFMLRLDLRLNISFK